MFPLYRIPQTDAAMKTDVFFAMLSLVNEAKSSEKKTVLFKTSKPVCRIWSCFGNV